MEYDINPRNRKDTAILQIMHQELIVATFMDPLV